MGDELVAERAFGTGDEKEEVELEKLEGEGSESGLAREEGVLEDLADVHLFEGCLEEGFFL